MSRAQLALLALLPLLPMFPLLAAHPAQAEPTVETVTDELHHPWALTFLPDGNLLVTERRGRLWRVDPASGERQAIDGLPEVDHRNQGGLLDVLAHPAQADNPWTYLTWAGRCDGGNATHLGRGRLEGNRLVDFETLFVATPCVDSGIHFGSRLAFDRDGYLFMTVGDRGERNRAQDLADHNGSVLRFHPDGRIPADNPFVDRPDAEAAIFSYGHRNPQGAATHPHTGRVWIHEHGPRGGDEINIPVAGENFGWPIQTYGREYAGPEIAPDEVEGVTGPLHHWTPSIAPSGMTFYDHDAAPDWRGNLFVGALAKRHLARLQLDGERVVSEERWLAERHWRVRDVEVGPDGALWVITDHADGRLLRLTPD
ncbi:PQQ-dependent sugar dehydrogenase [Guyparkeria halophila]|uniref:PQQ-dependent sugar dehydrogenase n=1 Tax=Guyparkeria halophila TaxID=47960 RepID=A0ABZ0YW10_9GAMM|nr:PQQ-dependent sugar dehydrogenase [Guyparkeria halophila]WQH16349.1 PQQ-dependent sugar dehydrogenase [Guyparkeria halophila]